MYLKMSLFTHSTKKSVRNPSFFFHLKTCWLQSRTSDLGIRQHKFSYYLEYRDINLFHLEWSHSIVFMTMAHPFEGAVSLELLDSALEWGQNQALWPRGVRKPPSIYADPSGQGRPGQGKAEEHIPRRNTLTGFFKNLEANLCLRYYCPSSLLLNQTKNGSAPPVALEQQPQTLCGIFFSSSQWWR